jgi:hypothetical protein
VLSVLDAPMDASCNARSTTDEIAQSATPLGQRTPAPAANPYPPSLRRGRATGLRTHPASSHRFTAHVQPSQETTGDHLRLVPRRPQRPLPQARAHHARHLRRTVGRPCDETRQLRMRVRPPPTVCGEGEVTHRTYTPNPRLESAYHTPLTTAFSLQCQRIRLSETFPTLGVCA